MRREIEPFDEATIISELSALPAKDRAKLAALLEFLEESQDGNPYPAQIDGYEHGLLRLRHVKAAYQGRAIFYVSESKQQFQKMVLLIVYKKETKKVPTAILETARQRMDQHKRKKK